MRHKTSDIAVLCITLLVGYELSPVQAQEAAAHHEHTMSAAKDNEGGTALEHTTNAMSSKQVDAGPHMKLTILRKESAQDNARAEEIAKQTKKALERYQDYRAALEEGYKIFLPNVPSKMKHFTNYRYAYEAAFRMNPEHPTSLLYEQHGSDYKLIGAMFTAPARLSEDDLNERIPLSVVQWHLHVNLCLPPQDQRAEMFKRNAKFGLAGSIDTEQACDAAGGRFLPRVFGWMVHVYPFEKSQEEIWSVARQMDHKH